MSHRTRLAAGLILVAAFLRALAQLAAMPPYAGLDELYHVARIAFVMNEDRNPTADERSVPAYLHRSLALAPDALPDFVAAGARWPEYVATRTTPLPDREVPDHERRTYLTPNYEAQQASPYYTLAAFIARVSGATTPLAQLRLWRMLSAIFAMLIIAAAMWIGFATFGVHGMLAASLIAFIPTWHTLTLRASNDAIACAFLGLALALSIRGGGTKSALVEGLLWSGAIVTKLFTWPALIVLPILWWRQRPSRGRMLIVTLLCIVSVALVTIELDRRTGVPVGLGAFHDPNGARGSYASIDYIEMAKITVASAVWMSGQHNNALSTRGMAMYVLPLLIAFAIALFRHRHEQRHRFWLVLIAASLIAFGAAQLFHATAHVRNAVAAGETMPLAGKEGWYWFALAPLLIPILGGLVTPRLLVPLFLWICGWDVAITQGALVRDYAGLTTPATPSALFRWGPAPRIALDAIPRLEVVAAGPFAGATMFLHILAILVALAAIAMTIATLRRGE